MKKPFLLSLALLASVSFSVPAFAQSEAEMNVRMMQLEDQIRQLVGQVEQLSFEVRQLKQGLPQAARKKAEVQQPDIQPVDENSIQTNQLPEIRKQADQSPNVEQIEEPSSQQITTTVVDENGNEQQVTLQKAPGPQILGDTMNNSSGAGDGGFQGQVLVAPGGEVVAGTKTISVDQEQTLDTPERIYEVAYESLLRRQFGNAESGFQSFLDKYRDHSLAGNAQYWLGETYYVQGDYKTAAKSFLTGYQDFPKSRKAADSLLKLGLSLNRLGQKEQACAAYSAVGEKFPKAAEARKRAQNELKRAGC